jgi:hypothetical protein
MKKISVCILTVILYFLLIPVTANAFKSQLEVVKEFRDSILDIIQSEGIYFYNKNYHAVPDYLLDEFNGALNKAPWNRINEYLINNELEVDCENLSAIQLSYGEFIFTKIKTLEEGAAIFLTDDEKKVKNKFYSLNFIGYENITEYGELFFFFQLLLNKDSFLESKIRWIFPNGICYDASLTPPFLKKVHIRESVIGDGMIFAVYCLIVLGIALVFLGIGLVVLVFDMMIIIPVYFIWPETWLYIASIGLIAASAGMIVAVGPGILCILVAPYL